MTEIAITDWDDAYANAPYIAGADLYPQRWADDAEAFRKTWIKKDLDIVYGSSARQRLDIFHPEGKSKGLVVFVHGGYWLKFDKSFWSHFATGSLAAGWTVCLPSYDLAPDVKISDITREIARALEKAGDRVAGPIRLAGHSAGGHLVSRMICEDTPLRRDIAERVEKVVSISGLHDLRPLCKTRMNDAFKMSEADAAAESAAVKNPGWNIPVVAFVGGEERPEFLRQSMLLADAWPNASYHQEDGQHHFNVLDGLKHRKSILTTALLEN